MTIRTDAPAPYAPTATVLQVIEGFRDRGFTTPFTPEILIRAGVTESLARRTLASLESLDLIDGDGNPTEAFEGLRLAPAEEYQNRLSEVVRAAYEEVFQFADPQKDPRSRVEDAFRGYRPAGQRKRMVVLFLGLCEAAGIIPPDAPAAQGTKKSSTHRRPTKSAAKPKEKGRAPSALRDKMDPAPSGIPGPIAGLLTDLPSRERGWSKAERDSFVATFTTLLDYTITVWKNGEPPQADRLEDEA